MLVSFIVPVYNVEKYLEECVNSLRQQTIKDVEIILVDDGSSDGSSAICDNFEKIDKRVKVIHKINGGLSDARNVGLNIAQGDYVIFIDSDDFWANEKNLEQLLVEFEKTPECDFIGFNCSYYYPSLNKIVKWVKYASEIENPISPKDCITKLVESGTFPMSACLKIFKRSLLQNNIEFIKNIYSEDIPWFIELLKKTNYCRFVNLYIYMYRKEVCNSISSSFSIKKFTDVFNSLKQGVLENIKEWDEKANAALMSFWAYEYCILIGMLGFMSDEERKVWRPILKEYEWLLNYKLNPKVRLISIIKKMFGYIVMEILLGKYIKTRMN